MPEVPKRLKPTPETLRDLYLRSGNLCAEPGCHERILDENGALVGQICHIEAAMPDGERFNPTMTNEERRTAANLILLCAIHHIRTNDVSRYPVVALKQMKADHEAKFSRAVEKLGAAFEDQTLAARGNSATSLSRINDVLGWHNTEEELEPVVEEIAALAEKLAKVPLPARDLLEIIVRRGTVGSYGSTSAHYDDILAAVGGEPEDVVRHVRLLEYHDVLYEDVGDDYAWIVLRAPKSGWPIWEDLRSFAKATDTPLRRLICDLRFDLLD